MDGWRETYPFKHLRRASVGENAVGEAKRRCQVVLAGREHHGRDERKLSVSDFELRDREVGR